MINYQLDYAAGRPQMYELKSRKRKAIRIIKTLTDFYGGESKLKKLNVLDVGSSTGIIDNVLAKKFKKVVGCDIDTRAISFAKKNFKKPNLYFKVEDAMELSFKPGSFDIVVCAQVYEHVPDAKRMFDQIYRVLKPGGVCYLAALNKLWPWEPHYNLPFLSWLPKDLANLYVRLTGKSDIYYENPQTFWGLSMLTEKFNRVDLTPRILKDPKKYDYGDILPSSGPFHLLLFLFAQVAKYFVPTFFWILVKRQDT